uniref:fimbrial protein n=1 Tax=Citrobacter freundii TaxID=546 RepID=UPI003211F75E
MKMKKGVFFLTLLSAYSFTALAAEMNAGTIHFTGEIIEPSCVIDGDNGTDSTIPLGTWPTSLFTAVGTETDLIDVDIKLTDCPVTTDGLTSVQLTFNGTTALTKSTTLLDVSQITTAGEAAATGVGIALSPKKSPTQLLAFDGSEGQVYIPLSTVPTDSIQANLLARYKSFATDVTAGPADADMTINILYR